MLQILQISHRNRLQISIFYEIISIFYKIIRHILHTTYSYLRAYIYARDTYLTADNRRLNIIVNVIEFTYARFGFIHSCSLAAALPPSL